MARRIECKKCGTFNAAGEVCRCSKPKMLWADRIQRENMQLRNVLSEVLPMQLYYILSLAHSPVGNHALFLGPNGLGYTQDISLAGVFLEDTINEDPGYYNNGKTTRAIRKEEVEEKAVLSVQWSDVQGFR